MRGFEELADEKKSKPSQLALAWLLAQGEDIVPFRERSALLIWRKTPPLRLFG
ncbi:hypothetical protein [Cohnella zeiphila]|uniref:hypothetical protein n=1 Tax=Cohnella zeiphila TaxID=2761120 RepID=UPI003B58B2FE